jgi:hypothetical protein
MTWEEFCQPAPDAPPPEDLGAALLALWHAKRGDWVRAHKIVQDGGNRDCDWVHAHLHRAEGDDSNAAYWYRRAGRHIPAESLEEEWLTIARVLFDVRPQ